MQVIEAVEKTIAGLETGGREVMLDLSTVDRIGAPEIQALEKLATAAGEKAVKISLRVGIDGYKVLKLVKLAPRFSFVT